MDIPEARHATTVIVCDGHRLFAEALAALLAEQGFVVLAVAQSREELVSEVRTFRPDVCLLERSLPGDDGLDVIVPVRAADPEARIIVLITDDDRGVITEALDRGAAGCVHKARGIAVLADSIDRVRDGAVVVDAVGLGTQQVHESAAAVHRLARYLTVRERECLALLVEGLGTRAMAERLGVAQTTVRSHVQSALTKLGAHSRLEAAALVVRYDLLRSGDLGRVV